MVSNRCNKFTGASSIVTGQLLKFVLVFLVEAPPKRYNSTCVYGANIHPKTFSEMASFIEHREAKMARRRGMQWLTCTRSSNSCSGWHSSGQSRPIRLIGDVYSSINYLHSIAIHIGQANNMVFQLDIAMSGSKMLPLDLQKRDDLSAGTQRCAQAVSQQSSEVKDIFTESIDRPYTALNKYLHKKNGGNSLRRPDSEQLCSEGRILSGRTLTQ